MARPPLDDSDHLPGQNIPISAITWLSYAAILGAALLSFAQ